jgi:hypothetical protein
MSEKIRVRSTVVKGRPVMPSLVKFPDIPPRLLRRTY